jgi:hypothetical protein
MGPAGATGATGATGGTGATGTSGFLGLAYANGMGAAPVDNAAVPPSPPTLAWIGVVATVTVAGPTQSVLVDATKALGSTTGASGLLLSICRRKTSAPSPDATPLNPNLDELVGLSVGPNQMLPFSLSGRFTGLAAGTYEFGLCGFTTPGQAANWNNNDWSRVRVVLAQ